MVGGKSHRTYICLISIVFLHSSLAPGAQNSIEERVIVTANAYPVPFENLSRTVTVLTSDEISRLPVHSIADVLAYIASVDVRSRSPLGLQADLSVRGSAFSQVLILVDGLRINNSQTGHHNSDFPVQLQDIERIEVLLGPGSSIYGADAFGGTINIITRRQVEKPRVSVSVGQFNLVEGSFAVGFHKGNFRQSLSATANRSPGFQYDRDFRSIGLNSHTLIADHTIFSISHANKEFGANRFYGPVPSKEWTNQTMISAEHRFRQQTNTSSAVQGYYRTHGDRFLYDIRKPDIFESRHRTHAAAVLAKTQRAFSDTLVLNMGSEAGGDWITSNNLGHHAFARMSVFSELRWETEKLLVIYPGLRFDYYSHFGAAVSPSLSGSWWIHPHIRLRSSVGRAYRIPTFTELYYHDPNHQANPWLKPETAWSAEAGADFIPARNWLGSLTLFSRQERNVIDWIRRSADEKWQTANIRRLHTKGLELSLERSWGSQARLVFNYSRLSSNAGLIDYISKYVLDYARDSWTTSIFISLPFALENVQSLNYRHRADGRNYLLWELRLSRRFRHFAATLDCTNLLNRPYQEIIGVDMPGRWLILSLQSQW